ncbi:hypothetical protein X743_33450 [Mesorhizobium sp. LNHC252B00]|nr:hypothetical protein X743_33450 [Mesorhizobium sp. LNHC252B00]
MAAERLSMRRVREILGYRFEEGLGHKTISYRVGAAPSTVRETLRRAEAAGLSWPLGEEVSDAVLEAALYKAAGTKTGHRRAPEPAQIVPVVMDGRAQAPLFAKVIKESRHLGSERDRPSCSTAGVIRLRDDLAKEMPHNAPDEVAIASTRISRSIGATSEQPIVDEWLDERLGLFDLIDIAGRGERCKLRQVGTRR